MRPLVKISHEELPAWGSRMAESIETVGFVPSVIVAIPTGGQYVAEALQKAMSTTPPIAKLSARRPSTNSVKTSSTSKAILARLPESMKTILRRIELHLVTKRLPVQRSVEAGLNDERLIRHADPANFVVVDDTIDTGASMNAVVNHILSIRPDATIKTAVFATSLTELSGGADIVLERDVLLQGPWSLDV